MKNVRNSEVPLNYDKDYNITINVGEVMDTVSIDTPKSMSFMHVIIRIMLEKYKVPNVVDSRFLIKFKGELKCIYKDGSELSLVSFENKPCMVMLKKDNHVRYVYKNEQMIEYLKELLGEDSENFKTLESNIEKYDIDKPFEEFNLKVN